VPYHITTGARNFDLQVSLKYDKKTEVKEYTFSSIDRSEFSSLHDFLTTRRLNVLMDEVYIVFRFLHSFEYRTVIVFITYHAHVLFFQTAKKANYAESDEDEGALPLATGSNDEDSEDDEDYEGSEHSSDDDDDDDDEDDTDNSEADENSSPQGRKNRPKAKSKGQQVSHMPCYAPR
jgi:nucleosome binding factor SPN SPT16 subunit